MVDVGDGLRAHDAAQTLLGQLQQAITSSLQVRFAQTTQNTHFSTCKRLTIIDDNLLPSVTERFTLVLICNQYTYR